MVGKLRSFDTENTQEHSRIYTGLFCIQLCVQRGRSFYSVGIPDVSVGVLGHGGGGVAEQILPIL